MYNDGNIQSGLHVRDRKVIGFISYYEISA